MTATPKEIDFQNVDDRRQGPSGAWGEKTSEAGVHENKVRGRLNKPRTAEGKLLTQKQIRARARRRAKRAEIMTDEEFNYAYKPIEEWDLDELAHGRPRGPSGTFRGPRPKWITAEVHERSMDRFKQAIRGGMNGQTPSALDAIQWILGNEEVDEKGKPLVPPGTKLDAAKFLLEHVVGKPTAHVEADLSVTLKGILGVVMANPEEAAGGYSVGHLPGVTMPMANDIIAGALADDGDLDWDGSDG